MAGKPTWTTYAGTRPRLTQIQQQLAFEFMTIKREVSATEAKRLPTVAEFAYTLNVMPAVLYRIARGKPYRYPNHRDQKRVA